ncbi:MAG TPA: hypothetical protein PLW72_16960 [Burkholderiaceae bacterium]|nr:hypothetical protein [Burkholderiaceae bacterium]
MTTAVDVVDVTRYAQEYERLRSQVSAASPERQPAAVPQSLRGIGLALLLRDGLPAWIRGVRQVLSQAASAAGKDGAAPSHPPRAFAAIPLPKADGHGSADSMSPSPLLEPARQRDLITLLASLVLSARRAPHPASMKEPSPCH